MASLEPIAVIGADGMLGRAFVRLLAERDVDTLPLTAAEVDLTDEGSVAALGDVSAGAVINCAAYTDVDGAEADEANATAVNGRGVALLAAACGRRGAALLHFSTDYVFDGSWSEPIPVDAPRSPINAYGRSKAEGEGALEASGADWLCVRTSWLYAPWGKNFVLTMAKLLADRDEVRVVDDQIGRPTSAVQLAERSLALLERGRRGIWHVTDEGSCSWHGLASRVATETKSVSRVLACGSKEFPRPARRPAYSVLDIERTGAELGPARAWEVEVSAALHEAAAREGEA